MVPVGCAIFGFGAEVKLILDYTFGRFIAVGILNTLAGLSIIYAAKYFFKLDDIPANLLGYGFGLMLSFFLNRSWTFRHGQGIGRALARFLIVFLVAYLANLVTLLFATSALGINSYVAQAVAIVPYTLVGYLGSKYFAFRPTVSVAATVDGH